jgi:hypothetical protein
MRSILTIAAVLALTGAAHAQETGNVTGCLDRQGRIGKLALGDEPSSPCRKGQTEISLALAGQGGGATQTFFVPMAHGEEVTLGTSGSLSALARCEETPGGSTRLAAVLTSETEPWFASLNAPNTVPHAAGETLAWTATTYGAGVPGFETPSLNRASAIAADGSFLAFSTYSAIVNLLDADCIAVGTVFAIEGDLAE